MGEERRAMVRKRFREHRRSYTSEPWNNHSRVVVRFR